MENNIQVEQLPMQVEQLPMQVEQLPMFPLFSILISTFLIKGIVLFILGTILKIKTYFYGEKYDAVFENLYDKLKTVDSLSQPEKDELMDSLYHEYQLAKQANNKVITQELPAFIKIENVIKNDVIRRTQKNINDFNTQLKQQFNQLEKPVQDLINIENYLFRIDKKGQEQNIDDLEKHQQQLEDLFKQHQEKFDQKITSVKQKLLFKEHIL